MHARVELHVRYYASCTWANINSRMHIYIYLSSTRGNFTRVGGEGGLKLNSLHRDTTTCLLVVGI